MQSTPCPRRNSLDGSIGINLSSGPTLPTIFFHDDESSSFTLPSKSSSPSASTSYPPPPSLAGLAATGRPMTSWGGEDLLSRLRSYASLLRSNLQPTLYLVDPSKADIEAHSTQLFSDDAVDEILARSSYANSHSPVPAHRRPQPLSTTSTPPNPYSQYSSVLHRSLPLPPSSPAPSSSPMPSSSPTRSPCRPCATRSCRRRGLSPVHQSPSRRSVRPPSSLCPLLRALPFAPPLHAPHSAPPPLPLPPTVSALSRLHACLHANGGVGGGDASTSLLSPSLRASRLCAPLWAPFLAATCAGLAPTSVRNRGALGGAQKVRPPLSPRHRS